MSRKSKTLDIWKQMAPASLRKLALAVFLMFSVLGPLTILMESELRLVSWQFVAVQTIASGGLAASIIIFARKRWWITFIIISFWSAVLVFNGGGLSLQFDDNSSFRVRLNGPQNAQPLKPLSEPLTLSPKELDVLYTQRGTIGVLAIALLAFGYVTFLKVIRKEVQHRARLETEVKIAQDIQQSLLPAATHHTSWVSIAGMAIPATEVAGDFFDVVQLSDDLIAVAIADVTGHGVGAGILSAMTKSALHSQLQHDPSPVTVLDNLNKTIYQLSDEKMFVTFAYMLLDRTTNRITLATAGHPPIFHRTYREGTIRQLRTASLGLGIRQEVKFSSLEIPLHSGDMLLCYTDGITEATNPRGEQFGTERLQEVFLAGSDASQKMCETLSSSVRKFTAAEAFEDDVTMVCVKFI